VKGRGFIFALLVLALLAAAVFGVKLRDEQEGKMQANAPTFPYSSYAVDELSLELPKQGRAATFRRGPEGWVAAGGTEHAKPEFAADLISAWSQVRYIDTVDENPTEEDLERYGLAEPAARLEARLQPGESDAPERASLVIGGPAPLADGVPKYYARINGFPRVVMVQATAGDLFLGVGREVLGLEPQEKPERPRGHGR
jgi:hypothetical protein